MKISCQACGAKYTIADEKIQGKVAKIRCRKCSTTIVVNGSAGADSGVNEAPDPTGSTGEATYTVLVAEGDQRTMTLAEVVGAYQSGHVQNETYVWTEGMADWAPLSDVSELVSAVSTGQSSPELPSPLAAESPFGAGALGGSEGLAAPEVAAHVPTAARRDANRNRVDLFGGGAGTGASSEDDDEEATRVGSPPQFASPAFSPAGDEINAPTGARNEQSVLFSLNAFAENKSASVPPKNQPKDDSGLIDLAALASAASQQGSQQNATSNALDPMLSAPVLGAPVLGSPILQPPPTGFAPGPNETGAKNRTGLYILGAAGILTLGGLAVALILSSGKPKEDPNGALPSITASAAAPSTVATDTAPPAPTSTAVDPSASPSASAPAATSPGVRKPTGGGGGPKAGSTPATGGAEKPVEPAKPTAPSSPCGCPPGDLNCAIKCSASKKK